MSFQRKYLEWLQICIRWLVLEKFQFPVIDSDIVSWHPKWRGDWSPGLLVVATCNMMTAIWGILAPSGLMHLTVSGMTTLYLQWNPDGCLSLEWSQLRVKQKLQTDIRKGSLLFTQIDIIVSPMGYMLTWDLSGLSELELRIEATDRCTKRAAIIDTASRIVPPGVRMFRDPGLSSHERMLTLRPRGSEWVSEWAGAEEQQTETGGWHCRGRPLVGQYSTTSVSFQTSARDQAQDTPGQAVINEMLMDD